MYYPNSIEELCYEQNHIDQVLAEIKSNIHRHLDHYVSSEAGNQVSDNKLQELANKFGSTSKAKKKAINKKDVLQKLATEAIDKFEKDRNIYMDLLDFEALEEYGEDVNSFKNTILRNQIPIIRKTLQNKRAKELDKYRVAFKQAQPSDLFEVVSNIMSLGKDWRSNWYESSKFEQITSCDDLDYYELDEENYVAHGVIGGGIKSLFLYKIYPEMFPYRSKEALWALWFLSDKKTFGCKQDSEFLMINSEQGTTHQNYFYPYGLFAFYALQIHIILKNYYQQHDIGIPEYHRFVLTNSFLTYVADQHQAEIEVLTQKADAEYDY